MATTEPQKWSATLGANADVNSLPATTPAGSGRASTSGLFPQITQKPLDEGGIAPERADFNALFKYLGDYIYYIMQGGVFSYLSTYAYTAGNLATFSGAVYECIAANGPGNVHAPTDTAYWRKLATLQDIPPAATVNDGQLTINVNGSQVATFTANQAGNSTADITVPAAPTVGDGTVTLHVAGSPSGSFTTNQTSNSIINVNKASDTTYGVVKVGDGITVNDGVISASGVGPGVFDVGSTVIRAAPTTENLNYGVLTSHGYFHDWCCDEKGGAIWMADPVYMPGTWVICCGNGNPGLIRGAIMRRIA